MRYLSITYIKIYFSSNLEQLHVTQPSYAEINKANLKKKERNLLSKELY